jgi:hypothetical protein
MASLLFCVGSGTGRLGWADHPTDADQWPITGYTHRRRQQTWAGCWEAEADSVKGKEEPQATRSTGEKLLLR